MRADNTAHLIAASSGRHELARSKAIRAIRELDAAGSAVTFESVAREASHRAAVSVVPCCQADPSPARQILTVAARIAPSPALASRESASRATVTAIR